MSVIELKNVSKAYGPVWAMNDVSLAVPTGELTAILGPSGSGKSTMLSMIAGIVTPTNGTISIGGRDVTYAAPGARNVGLVFQSYALFPHLSVFENVAFPLRIRRMKAADVTRHVSQALERVRLLELKDRKPSQLSGGQQQRVAIARAIVFRPSVLLLDEPLAALDRKLREDVRLELRGLQRSLGITTVLVTHDQDEALSMADRVAVMSDGRIQQIDAPQAAYRRPRNRFVANFLGIANLLEGQLTSSGGAWSIALPEGDRFPCARPEHEPAADGTVCGVLRPEQIVVQGDGSHTALRARVDEVIFFGQAVQYVLTTERGRSLTAHCTNPKHTFEPGAVVALTWDPDDVWVLPEDKTIN